MIDLKTPRNELHFHIPIMQIAINELLTLPAMTEVLRFPLSQSGGDPGGGGGEEEEEVKNREKRKRETPDSHNSVCDDRNSARDGCNYGKTWPFFLAYPIALIFFVSAEMPLQLSATVFGVSTESMQLSYDSRGNSVPTILLQMQWRLNGQGGLQAEGILRINGENSQEYVREQLNDGVVPDRVDAHCLAGLIKAWFRELPSGVLDSLNPEQVMQCQTEEQCFELAKLLPPTEYALLDWAINLTADVVEHEHLNKMNARNIAVIFAPNMSQASHPEPFNDDRGRRLSVSCIRDGENDNRERVNGDQGLIPSVRKQISDKEHSEEKPAPVDTFISEKDTTGMNHPKQIRKEMRNRSSKRVKAGR
ncbi:Rho GTPase-activating protein 1 [Hibiscus syriacus]|uniref:Rho GTPase-activating protein 1 n=1 Tax=Hibiscus syriacus TaxID=106335 RepID=A0A6A2Z6K9_HIBSY|nr:Rho GTPase-activating protein 1 [Hibiscus syriacus]